jgi:hypothetical protein
VAHACNPSYSGGRDQEDLGSKPAWANRSRDPIPKNPSQKRAGGVVQKKKKKTRKEKEKWRKSSTAPTFRGNPISEYFLRA